MSTPPASNNRSRKKRKKSGSGGKKKFDPVAFWGTPDSIPTPEGFETSTPDSVAVVNSLGQPPLPGHGAASPHYFKLVYDRSTQLAAALAMAGGIEDLAPEDLPEAEPGNEAELIENSADEPITEASTDEEE
jgi:hypothetical protein